MRRRRSAWAVLILVLAAACTTDPFAVPAVIDVAYVNRVLAALDEALGDVTRLVVRTRSVPPEAVERLRAIYADDRQFRLAVEGYEHIVATGLIGLRPELGNRRSTVVDLLRSGSDCVFARVERDISAVALSTNPSARFQWIALVRRPTVPVHNPTSWAYVFDGFGPGFTQPLDPCAR